MPLRALFAAVLLTLAPDVPGSTPSAIVPAPLPANASPLPVRVVGRVEQHGSEAGRTYRRQWPGTYFETRFVGDTVYVRVGDGDVALEVSVDGRTVGRLVRPRAGDYRIGGLSRGEHRLRVAVTSESQAGATNFGGFFASRAGAAPRAPSAPARQIEFIGDSHTVGYGNTSPVSGCSEREVWETTDTGQGIAPRTAARYRADYQVNAISGRGIVRNYNGMAADTLPQAYPFNLFDRATRYADPAWRPEVIVIALGTNDFSTALHAGERWSTRAQLRADYEATYVRFVQHLRARQPQAFFLLWATDLANGEIAAETGRVVDQLRAAGEKRIAFVPVRGLAFSGCNNHPSVADDQVIGAALGAVIDAQPGIWRRSAR